jgi:hypothetical protein
MKEKLTELARKAKSTASDVAKKTADLVQAHKPSQEDMARAKTQLRKAGKAVGDGAVEMGREMAETKAFKDGAKGAAVGAGVGIPLPVIGPAIGAVVGAGVGVYLGRKKAKSDAAAGNTPAPLKDLHDELLKLDALRKQGLLTDAEFETRKRKLMKST